MHKIELYYIPTCSYCQKVLNFIKQHNISIPLKDRDADPMVRNELIKIGGEPQVPCLVIDGKALYESKDIIDWFKKNLVKK